jgi:pilus assembly protein CpaE
MIANPTVLVVTDESTTADAVVAAVRSNGNRGHVDVCESLARLPARLRESNYPIVVVDLDPKPGRALEELEPIIRQFAATRFIVVSHDVRQEWLLQALEVGARQFLLKQDVASRLEDVLRRLAPPPPAADSAGTGTVVTLLPASGGCGTTLLAINLANELYLATSSPTLLLDLDTQYGSIASYLGLNSEYTIADVLADPGRIDPELVRSTAVPYRGQLEVLLSPASTHPFESVSLRWENLRQTVEACKEAFTFTVIDAPRLPSDVAIELAAASTVTFIVFEQNVEDLRVARAMIRVLRERGLAMGEVCALANRWCHGFGRITSKETRTALGACPMARIRNDFKSAINSINCGQPLSVVARRSVLRDDICALAKEIEKIHSRTGALTQWT